MANRLVSVDDNFDFPKGVTDRQAERIAQDMVKPGTPLNTAINATVGDVQAPSTVQHGGNQSATRPRASQVTWVGWVRPANMDVRDIWLEIDEPPFTLEGSINWAALWTAKSAGTSHTDGQSVSTWADASGNGVSLTQATAIGATALPVYRSSVAEFGGKPALQFASSPLGGTIAATTQPCTAIFLARHTKTASSMIGPLPNLYRATAGPVRASAGDVLDIPNSSDTQPHLFIAEYDGLNSTVAAGARTGAGKMGSRAFGGTVYVGGHDSGSHMGGHMVFGGVVHGLLDAKTKASLIAWVGSEYGVTA